MRVLPLETDFSWHHWSNRLMIFQTFLVDNKSIIIIVGYKWTDVFKNICGNSPSCVKQISLNLPMGRLWINFDKILNKISNIAFKKMSPKKPLGKCRPFCRGLNVLSNTFIRPAYPNTSRLLHWEWGHLKASSVPRKHVRLVWAKPTTIKQP